MSEALPTLQVDTGRAFRGGQRQVALLVRGLAEAGHPVELAVPPGAPLAAAVAGRAGIVVHELPMRGEFDPRAVRRLARLLAGRRPAVIHVHTAHAITLAHAARRLVRWSGPLVAHRHVAFAGRRNPLARLKRRWPEGWIAVSRAVASRLVDDGVPHDRVHVVPAALDPESLTVRRAPRETRATLGLDDRLPLLVFVGALTPNKNPGLLVEGLRRLATSGQRARLLLVGDGPLRDELARRAERAGLGDAVHLLGEVPNAADLIAAADLALFASRSEGSHSALKEALALAVPVLASRIPAHRELDLPDEMLFDPDDADELAAKLGAALADLEDRRARAQRLAGIAARFAPTAMVEGVLAVYRSVLGQTAPSPGS
ncbi:MAG: glycosyltransferase [Acidobacteria bacterium]|nr:MAG: glycosyltransferase [Acidobacteriota bacterium]